MKLASVFSDGAVLQRRTDITVWGTAEKEALIECSLNGNSACTRAAIDGSFKTRLAPMEAGGPYTMRVKDLQSGETLEIHNVLLGEVWIASGQSNMQLAISETPIQFEEYINERHPSENIRFLVVPVRTASTEEHSFDASWFNTTHENLRTCGVSAAALWFAAQLYKMLGVPVGVIQTAQGGTTVETWTSRNTLIRIPETREILKAFDARARDEKLWRDVASFKLAAHDFYESCCEADIGISAEALPWSEKDFDCSSWDSFRVPSAWTDGHGSIGSYWIRRTIQIPDHWNGLGAILHTGGIDKTDISFLNGMKIGSSGTGFDDSFWDKKRAYTIEKIEAGQCTIAIRAYSFAFAGCFGGEPADWYIECVNGEKISISGEWRGRQEHEAHPHPSIWNSPVMRRPGNQNMPCALFNGMIRPILPYTVRGVIWYQGENNAENIEQARQYEKFAKALVEDWRSHWEQPTLPFIMTLLAGFGAKTDYCATSAWARLRESQRRTAEAIDEVYLASAVDAGEENNIHPQDKRTVGYRLAVNAAANVYGLDTTPCGPEFLRAIREGNGARLFFRHAHGLRTISGNTDCKGFCACGADTAFMPAEAVADGGSIFVKCKSFDSSIEKIRYSWSHFPTGDLCNSEGLPAIPFECSVN